MPEVRSAFGAFLRSRRDRLTPAEAGIRAFAGPRRVPGLRREELASIAGLSTDYYSRLEQGRQAAVSDSVLDALSGALRLDAVEAAHLRDLAAPVSRRAMVRYGTQRPDPGLLRVAASLEHLPVLLLGQRAEVLYSNALLVAVLGRSLPVGASYMEFLFRDPLARQRIVNWGDFARQSVAGMRREAARRPDDPLLTAAIESLRSSDPDVAAWWNDQTVRDYASVRKQIDHPDAGLLEFDLEIVLAPHDTDQHLIIYTAPAASVTARVLPILASWSAGSAAVPLPPA